MRSLGSRVTRILLWCAVCAPLSMGCAPSPAATGRGRFSLDAGNASSFPAGDGAGTSSTPPPYDMGGGDASTPAPTAEPDAGPPAPTCTPFTGTPGINVGDHFVAAPLQTCNGQAAPLYDADLCSSSYTVVMFSAGWCPECVSDSPALRSIADDYQSRGVKVLDILIGNDNYDDMGVPSQSYCQQWATTNNIRGMVRLDSNTLDGPTYTPDYMPTLYIVDSQGIIQYRDGSGGATLPYVRQALDALLAGG